MVKIGKVYLDSRDKNYYYVRSLTKVKGRIHYILNKINSIGTLGKEKTISRIQIKKYKTRFKIQNDVLVKITFALPRDHRDRILWQQLIKDGRKEVRAITKVKEQAFKMQHKTTLAKQAYYSVGHLLPNMDRESNLRDFAQAVGFKQPSKLYAILANHLEAIIRPKERNIRKLQDSTLRDKLRSFKMHWKLIHGFSKKIDAILEAELATIMKEFNRRGLSL